MTAMTTLLQVALPLNSRQRGDQSTTGPILSKIINGSATGQLGFSLIGGQEHDLGGIYIHQLNPTSPNNDIVRVGDRLLEVRSAWA